MDRKNNFVPILMYHHVTRDIATLSKEERPYAVTVDNFEKQLDWLSQNGYQSIIPGEKPDKREAPCVVLTFDDGARDNFTEAYPRLRGRGFKAVFFITAGFVGLPGHMTWKDICELLRGGMEIGTHGMTHRFFSELSLKELKEEVAVSKESIEKNTGAKVNMISLPGGRGHKELFSIALDAGYKCLFTSRYGYGKPGGVWNLPRIPVMFKTTICSFEKIMVKNTVFTAYQSCIGVLKSLFKKLLGHDFYHKVYQRYAEKQRAK